MKRRKSLTIAARHHLYSERGDLNPSLIQIRTLPALETLSLGRPPADEAGLLQTNRLNPSPLAAGFSCWLHGFGGGLFIASQRKVSSHVLDAWNSRPPRKCC
jgi:hypothetical protein